MAVCRYAKHYLEDKVPKRTLLKVFGIRLDIIVQSLVSNTDYWIFLSIWISDFWTVESLALCPSQARKFDIIPTLTAIGSGVGIFGVVCCSPATCNIFIYGLWNTLYINYNNSDFTGNCSMRLGAALFATKKGILPQHEIQTNRHTRTGKLYDACKVI